jgi:DNA polymerase-3 subunit alpha
VPSRTFDQNRSARLSRILQSYPGRDAVVLMVQQADGRRFRAELPVSVDAQSPIMKAEIRDLFEQEVMIA